MSRHIPRHARWDRRGANEYVSGTAAVRFQKGAWWAEVDYEEREAAVPPGPFPVWHACHKRLGPFPRPRNAMMAAEEHVLLLQRRLGEAVRFGTEPGA